MKVPTITGTNIEEFDMDFTAKVRSQNNITGISLDYLLRKDTIVNYNAAYNSWEENLKFCDNLQGKDFNYDAETLYNILVQYFGTSGTGSNNVSRHTSLKN